MIFHIYTQRQHTELVTDSAALYPELIDFQEISHAVSEDNHNPGCLR